MSYDACAGYVWEIEFKENPYKELAEKVIKKLEDEDIFECNPDEMDEICEQFDEFQQLISMLINETGLELHIID